jgi:hypothetical protein
MCSEGEPARLQDALDTIFSHRLLPRPLALRRLAASRR